MIVKICVPRNSGIRKIIVDYYYNLYTQHRLRNPHSSYTLKQMKEYVKHAYSYLRLPLDTDNLKNRTMKNGEKKVGNNISFGIGIMLLH